MSITDEQVTEAIEAAVREKGEDYVNRTGKYLERDQDGSLVPSCIVGHVLVALGVPVSDIEPHEMVGARGVIEALSLSVSATAVDALGYAQSEQDLSAPWGEALEAYRAEMGR